MSKPLTKKDVQYQCDVACGIECDCSNRKDFIKADRLREAVEWLKKQPYTHQEDDSEDGENFFDVIIIKVSDFNKAFNEVFK